MAAPMHSTRSRRIVAADRHGAHEVAAEELSSIVAWTSTPG